MLIRNCPILAVMFPATYQLCHLAVCLLQYTLEVVFSALRHGLLIRQRVILLPEGPISHELYFYKLNFN